MHVLLTTDAIGGVWNYTIALARSWSAQGIECSIAVIGPDTSQAQRRIAREAGAARVIDTGYELDWVVKDRGALDHVSRGLADLAARLGVASVHLHAPALASSGFTIPVVAVAHSCMGTWWRALRTGALPAEFAWHSAATRDGLGRADAVIAPSGAFALSLRQVYDVSRDIRVVYNGLPEYTSTAESPRVGVLTAGRLWDEAKNIAVLDDAAAIGGLSIKAAGAVQGPHGETFTVRHLQLLGNLPQPELRMRMHNALIFASPARYEPFGLVALEAAQCATPLVLSDIPSFRELWDGAAEFVPGEDAGAWAATLTSLLQDPGRCAALGQRARIRARRFTASALCTATTEIHRGLWDQARVRRVA